MPKNRLVRALDSRRTARAAVTNVPSGGGTTVTLDHGTLTGLADDDHTQYLNTARGDARYDARYVPLARTVTAGNGLTGGGALSANITLNVGAGAGITVNNDDVALASSVAGAGLAFNTGVLSIASSAAGNGLTLTSGVLAVGAGAGISVAADSVALASGVAGAGLTLTNGVLDVGAGAGITVNANDVALASSVAGNGLKFTTGQLSIDAGTLITVGTTSVGLSNGTAQYQIPVTGGTPFTPAYTALSTFAGNGLDFSGGKFVVGQGAGLTVGATTVALTTPGTLTHNSGNSATGSHTHAITSSDNVNSSTTSLLRATNGALTLDSLTATTRLRSPLLDTASGNMSLAPAGDVILDPTGNDVLPENGYDINLGMLTKKFLTLHAAELWVETLVAQNTIATIGGRILVGPTTTLIADLSTGATTIDVKHNEMVSGDIAYLEANGNVEGLRITSGPSTITGGFRYSVDRAIDNTPANAWAAGDAVFNTGQTGDGFIDLYSVQSIRRRLDGTNTQVGPTIVGNVRTATTNFTDWAPRWAIGNLNGLYGYSTDVYGFAAGNPDTTWLSADATNGIRVNNGSHARFQVTAGGSVFVRDAAGANRVSLDAGTGLLGFFDGTNQHARLIVGSTGIRLRDSNANDVIVLDNSGNASFTGTVTAGAGAIANWAIGTNTLTSGNVGLNSNTTPGTFAFYAGNATAASAPFRVTNGGVLTATDATITGAITASSGSFTGTVSIASGGSLTFGGSAGVLDSTGIYIVRPSTASLDRGYTFRSGSSILGGLYIAYGDGGSGSFNDISLRNFAASTQTKIILKTDSGTSTPYKSSMLELFADPSNSSNSRAKIFLNDDEVFNLAPTRGTVIGDLELSRGNQTNNLTRTLTIEGGQASSGTNYAVIDFSNYDGSAAYTGARISSQNDDSVSDGDLRFFTANGGVLATSPALRIDSLGNILFGGDVTTNVTISKATPQLILTPTGTSAAQIKLQASDIGSGIGSRIILDRNNNASSPATPAAGHVRFINRQGTAYHVWPDNGGDLRIGTSTPTSANDTTTGVVVGTQTSHESFKTLLEGETPIAEVLARLAAASAHVHRFEYRHDAMGMKEETFEGLVLREDAPETHYYGTDKYAAGYSAGKCLNMINLCGDLLRAVVHLNQRLEALH